VVGVFVKSLGKTFDKFWDSRLTEIPKKVEPPEDLPYEEGSSNYQQRKYTFDKNRKIAEGLFAPNKEVDRVLKILEVKGKEDFLENEKKICPEVAFASDKEGASYKETLNPEEYGTKYRHLRQEIAKWMDQKIKDEVIIDTPYFLNNVLTDKLRQVLRKKKAKVRLFTNSLASTDAIHVSSVFSGSITDYTPFDNFKAYVYKGKYSGEGKIHDEKTRNATWGTHAKTLVFSKDAFMIGSNNFDNRSSYYNTELALFCSGSPELTKDVSDNIQKRMDNSFKLDSEGNGEDCDVYGEVGTVKKTIYNLIKIPSYMFQHLL
jgi:putative cardiolipin synthase